MIWWRQAQHDLHQLPEGTAIIGTGLADAALVLEAPLQGGNRLDECGVGRFERAWLVRTRSLPSGQ